MGFVAVLQLVSCLFCSGTINTMTSIFVNQLGQFTVQLTYS